LVNNIYNYVEQLCVMSEYTTVRLNKQTVELLKEIGRKDESYDRVILRLIEAYYERIEKKDVKPRLEAKAN
jgi:hypothetical protein